MPQKKQYLDDNGDPVAAPGKQYLDDEGRPDCADWFASHGWTARTVSAREEAARLGREPQSEDRPFTNSFVTATKP
jgi:O-methyltransferase involved in polyketide biosynthesis